MGRKTDPGVAKAILQHLRNQDLREAWVSNGKPGTWKHVQRAAKAAREAARHSTKAFAPPPPTAPRPAGVKRKEAGADGAAGSSKGAAASSSKRQPAIGTKTIATTHQVDSAVGARSAVGAACRCSARARACCKRVLAAGRASVPRWLGRRPTASGLSLLDVIDDRSVLIMCVAGPQTACVVQMARLLWIPISDALPVLILTVRTLGAGADAGAGSWGRAVCGAV